MSKVLSPPPNLILIFLFAESPPSKSWSIALLDCPRLDFYPIFRMLETSTGRSIFYRDCWAFEVVDDFIL